MLHFCYYFVCYKVIKHHSIASLWYSLVRMPICLQIRLSVWKEGHNSNKRQRIELAFAIQIKNGIKRMPSSKISHVGQRSSHLLQFLTVYSFLSRLSLTFNLRICFPDPKVFLPTFVSNLLFNGLLYYCLFECQYLEKVHNGSDCQKFACFLLAICYRIIIHSSMLQIPFGCNSVELSTSRSILIYELLNQSFASFDALSYYKRM